MKSNYRQIPEKLRNLEAFDGNSMRAIVPVGRDASGDYVKHMGRLYLDPMEASRLNGKTLRYIVFSYTTPIAVVTDSGECITFDIKHSPTTSRQQNLCRAWMGRNVLSNA